MGIAKGTRLVMPPSYSARWLKRLLGEVVEKLMVVVKVSD